MSIWFIGDQVRAFIMSWKRGKVSVPPRFLTRPVDAKAAGEGLSSPKSCDTGVWNWRASPVDLRGRPGRMRAELGMRVVLARAGVVFGNGVDIVRCSSGRDRDNAEADADEGRPDGGRGGNGGMVDFATDRSGEKSKSSLASLEGAGVPPLRVDISLLVGRSPLHRARKVEKVPPESSESGSDVLRWPRRPLRSDPDTKHETGRLSALREECSRARKESDGEAGSAAGVELEPPLLKRKGWIGDGSALLGDSKARFIHGVPSPPRGRVACSNDSDCFGVPSGRSGVVGLTSPVASSSHMLMTLGRVACLAACRSVETNEEALVQLPVSSSSELDPRRGTRGTVGLSCASSLGHSGGAGPCCHCSAEGSLLLRVAHVGDVASYGNGRLTSKGLPSMEWITGIGALLGYVKSLESGAGVFNLRIWGSRRGVSVTGVVREGGVLELGARVIASGDSSDPTGGVLCDRENDDKDRDS